MSTDFIAVCDACRIKIHAGQRMGLGFSLAYGGKDWSVESRPILQFIFDHAYCDIAKGVRILVSDVAEDRDCDEYAEWRWDEGEVFPEPRE